MCVPCQFIEILFRANIEGLPKHTEQKQTKSTAAHVLYPTFHTLCSWSAAISFKSNIRCIMKMNIVWISLKLSEQLKVSFCASNRIFD